MDTNCKQRLRWLISMLIKITGDFEEQKAQEISS